MTKDKGSHFQRNCHMQAKKKNNTRMYVCLSDNFMLGKYNMH